MVELNRLTIAPLQRAPGAGRVGGVPSSPQVSGAGVQALGQAGRALGQNLGQAGAVLNEVLRDQATRRQALQVATDNSALGQARLGAFLRLEEIREGILGDRGRDPLTRTDAFIDQSAPVITQAIAAAPISVRGRLQSDFATRISSIIRGMGDEAEEESIAIAQETLTNELEEKQRAIARTADPVDRARLQAEQAQLLAQGVVTGIVRSTADVKIRLRGLQDDAAVLDVRLEMERGNALSVLERLTQGPAANPDLPPEMIPTLINEAETALTEENQASDRREKQGDELKEQEENAFFLEQDAIVADPTTSIADLQAVSKRLSTAGIDERFSAAGIRVRQAYIVTQVTARRTEGRRVENENDSTMLAYARRRVYGDTLLANVEEVMGYSGLNATTSRQMLLDVRARERTDHVAKTPEYTQASRLISRRILGSPDTNIFLDTAGFKTAAGISEQRRDNAALASAYLWNRAVSLSGPRGVDTREFRQKWQNIAFSILAQFDQPEDDLAIPTFASPADLTGLAAATTAFRLGQISQTQYTFELFLGGLVRKKARDAAQAAAAADRAVKQKQQQGTP